MHYLPILRDDWAPSAWLLRLPRNPGAQAISSATLEHGVNVELGDCWFCEGVWDAPFSAGDFDRSDRFFGSGGRWRDGILTVVSSWAPCDRLQSFDAKTEVLVSNSLPCLLAGAGLRLAVSSVSFIRICNSILLGVGAYLRELPTDRGSVLLTYCQNLTWNGGELRQLRRSGRRRHPATFEAYRNFLSQSLGRISSNMRDTARSRPLNFLAGISRGYDSLTVCILAREHGLSETFTCRESRHFEDDDGTPFARALGLDVHAIGRTDWRRMRSHPEIPFIVGDGTANGMEIAALEPALLRDRVLLSGWFGDKVWSRDSEPERFEDYRGENFNGLYLTEFRLWRGFIHLPAPFLGVADLPDIVQTSRSPAMAAWDYAPAADPGYSRPICRRIIEGAGIARDSFASEKLGTMASGREARYTAASLRAIRSWLRQRNPGVVRGQMASLSSACRSAADAGVELAVAAITRCLPERSRLRENLWRSLLRWRRANFHRVDAVGWGMEEASKRYGISDKR